jgi:CO/xanthine dehydrogenase FAD-binding subunit
MLAVRTYNEKCLTKSKHAKREIGVNSFLRHSQELNPKEVIWALDVTMDSLAYS